MQLYKSLGSEAYFIAQMDEMLLKHCQNFCPDTEFCRILLHLLFEEAIISCQAKIFGHRIEHVDLLIALLIDDRRSIAIAEVASLDFSVSVSMLHDIPQRRLCECRICIACRKHGLKMVSISDIVTVMIRIYSSLRDECLVKVFAVFCRSLDEMGIPVQFPSERFIIFRREIRNRLFPERRECSFRTRSHNRILDKIFIYFFSCQILHAVNKAPYDMDTPRFTRSEAHAEISTQDITVEGRR